MIAEKIKGDNGGTISKRTRLLLEVIIPFFSLACLLGVTGWILFKAIGILRMKELNGDSVNVSILYAYASVNMIIDIFAGCMFYVKRREVFLDMTPLALIEIASNEDASNDDAIPHSITNDEEPSAAIKSEYEVNLPPVKNFNMLSAFTHVGSDTLRTLSLFCAALSATFSSTPSSICDAWAAIAVSITIAVFSFCLAVELSVKIWRVCYPSRSNASKLIIVECI